jgi:hypothetical protein
MGRKVLSSGIGDALFSKTQQAVLRLLYGQPGRTFFAKELIGLAKMGSGTVQRELERLTAAGLIMVHSIGNQRHYQANPRAPIFDELRAIVFKTFGVADHLREALAPLAGRIQAAFIYGSVARGTDTARSDIDVMILAEDISFPEVLSAISLVEQDVGRPANPAMYGIAEWRRKLEDKGGFLQRVMKQPRIFLIGADDDLPQPR